jgi:hypothetical protein
MKTVAYSILLWFGVFLAMFLCITVLNAVVTGLAGADHSKIMANAYKGYAGISGLIATALSLTYLNENKQQIPRTGEDGDRSAQNT